MSNKETIAIMGLYGKRIHGVPFENVGDKFFKAIHEVQKTKSTISIEYSMRLEDQEYYYEARLQGLAIVQKIIEEHGGFASLKSEPDLGTKATVVLPVQIPVKP